MENNSIFCQVFKSAGRGNWVETFKTTDPADVYERLAVDMIAKKINHCSWIKSVHRVQLYTGYINIIVDYNNGTRAKYHIRNV